MQTLDEATNSLVNPSGLNLTDPDDSRAYADQVWQAGVLLNVAIDEPQHLTSEGVKSIEPCDVFPVAQRALEEVLLQLPLVNDPVGSVVWCAGRLAQELPPAAQLAQVDGLRLAEWLLGVLESPYAEQVDGPDPRKVDTSGVSYAALVSVAEFSASKTSGAERLHQECRRRVL